MRVRAAVLALALPAIARAQSTTQPTVAASAAPPTPRPFHLEVSGFYHALDNDYGPWRGVDLRLLYVTRRFTPFAFLSSQTRREGTQQNAGIGSYVTIAPGLYAILGVSAAPGSDVVLYPRVRADAMLAAAVPGVPGLLANAGLTEIRYDQAGQGGRIVSVGPTLYRGRGIYTGVVRFNTDRASGLHSHSYQVGGQWGAQGRYWVGGSVGAGNEAYQVLSVTPFDARFESRLASAFYQRWLAPAHGVTVRYDFERKLRTYQRHGFTVGYFVDF